MIRRWLNGVRDWWRRPVVVNVTINGGLVQADKLESVILETVTKAQRRGRL